MNKCNLIGDLLPLYNENLLSEDSIKVVERHLAKCEACAKKANLLRSPEPEIPEELPREETLVLKRTKRKFKLKTALITTASTLLSAVIVFFTAYTLAAAIRSREADEKAREERIAELDSLLDSCREPEERLVRHDPIELVYEPYDSYTLASTLSNRGQFYKISLPGLIQFAPYDVNSWRYTGEGYLEAAYISAKYDTTLSDISERAMNCSPIREKDMREAYSALYDYAALNWGKNSYVNLAKYALEYSFDGLTAESPLAELHKAFAADGMRGYFIERYDLGSGGEYYPINYYPITGSLNGYALFIQMNTRVGGEPAHWEIYLQSESAVWKLEFWVRDTAEDSFVSNIGNMREYLSHIRFE